MQNSNTKGEIEIESLILKLKNISEVNLDDLPFSKLVSLFTKVLGFLLDLTICFLNCFSSNKNETANALIQIQDLAFLLISRFFCHRDYYFCHLSHCPSRMYLDIFQLIKGLTNMENELVSSQN